MAEAYRRMNPFAQPPKLVQLTIEAPAEVLDVIELVVEDEALATTRPIEAVTPHLVLIATPQTCEALEKKVRQVGKQFGAKPKVRVIALEPIDWVKQVQKDFPPFRLGPFYVYGAASADSVPADALKLRIEAAAAFGTGEHETTACCLLALAAEKKTRPRVDRVLDMGCGTAILAIGAARLWPGASITACDNDAVAVKVTRENFAANAIRHARAICGDGYRDARIGGDYEIIVANILARPLIRMAPRAAAALAPGGTLILSGLLVRQEAMVLAAHRAQGLRLVRRFVRGRWVALTLT